MNYLGENNMKKPRCERRYNNLICGGTCIFSYFSEMSDDAFLKYLVKSKMDIIWDGNKIKWKKVKKELGI